MFGCFIGNCDMVFVLWCFWFSWEDILWIIKIGKIIICEIRLFREFGFGFLIMK